MTPIKPEITRATLLAISGLLASSFALCNNASADVLQVGRYQTVRLQPTEQQRELLTNIIEVELEPDITTIGEAIGKLLDGSGYRLLSAKLAEPYRTSLFAMPLPELQRTLGPMSLQQALELLSGPAFELVIEPVYRLVSFELITIDDTSEHDVGANE